MSSLLESFVCISKSGMVGCYGGLAFSFLRNLHTDSQNVSTSLLSYQQQKCAFFPPNSHQHFLSFFLLIMAILTGIVLIFISLITKMWKFLIKMSLSTEKIFHLLRILCLVTILIFLVRVFIFSVFRVLFFFL